MTSETLPPTISVEQAGELLGVSRRSAYRAAARGQIPTLKVGRRLLVPTQRLLGLLGIDGPSPPASDTAPGWATTTFSTTTPAFDVAELHDGIELSDQAADSMRETR